MTSKKQRKPRDQSAKWLSFWVFVFSILSSFAAAKDASVVCDHAAAVAASSRGVPISVLKAISLTETGRASNGAVRPWPWTVNMEGKGVWFEQEDDARAYVYQHYKRGARSFDVGCFQLNYKWHHKEFDSLDDMFDPIKNAEYAADFLKSLYTELGSWEKAAGAYHSRTPEHAVPYQQNFSNFRENLVDEDDRPIVLADYALELRQQNSVQTEISAQPSARTPRVNSFPLLQRQNGSSSRGSLVPLGGSKARGDFIDFGAS
ncbi:MAG: transglycosylase SLT domain-containing protein [Maritimibacter sp.]